MYIINILNSEEKKKKESALAIGTGIGTMIGISNYYYYLFFASSSHFVVFVVVAISIQY